MRERAKSCRADWAEQREFLCKIYRHHHGREPNLSAPRLYTEKILWRKLYDLNPAFRVFCDKLAAREVIAERIGAHFLPPLLWQGSSPREIPFQQLHPPYVIKTSHGSGQVLMIQTQEDVRPVEICRQLARWLARPYGQNNGELAYRHVERRILIEEQVFGPLGQRPLERRCFVFHGQLRFINTVFIEGEKVRNGAFHTADWERVPWYFSRPLLDVEFAVPKRLVEIISIAERLASNCDHTRVDIFDGGNEIWVGEITVYPWSGHAILHPQEADGLLGACWHIPFPCWQAWWKRTFSSRDIP